MTTVVTSSNRSNHMFRKSGLGSVEGGPDVGYSGKAPRPSRVMYTFAVIFRILSSSEPSDPRRGRSRSEAREHTHLEPIRRACVERRRRLFRSSWNLRGGAPSMTSRHDEGDVGSRWRVQGKSCPAALLPSGAASHPSSGQAGDLFVDVSHRLWFCKGGTTWVLLA